jgi:choline dehydrogenase-like flavoprotein
LDYEAIIVGGGTTGSLIAYELGRLGRRVLVVEAGGTAQMKWPVNLAGDGGIEAPPHFRQSFRMNSDLGTQYHLAVRGLGGAGQVYAGWAYRYNPIDFCLKSTYAVGADWPLTFQELLPFYLQAERLIGISGQEISNMPGTAQPYPMPAFPIDYATQVFNRKLKGELAFTPAPQSRNRIPYDGRPACRGYRMCWECPLEAKWTPQNCVIRKSYQLKNVEYLIKSPVVFVEVGSSGKVDSIRCLSTDGEKRLTAGIFVIACNGIETPRLMLHCKQPNAPAGIANSTGLVGRNYMGHPHVDWLIDLGENVYGGRGPLHSSNCTHFADHPDRANSSAVNLHYIQATLPEIKLNTELWGEALIRDAQADTGQVVHLGIESEMLADERSFISLDQDVDQLGLPIVRINYFLTDYVRRGLERIAEILRAAERRGDIKGFEQNHPEHDGGHWMGATRMGSSRENSVADSFGRTWDHPNLFIVGASLYPTSTPFNPIETSVALVLRAAPEIESSLKAKA